MKNLVIVGTCHDETTNYTAKDLVTILEKINPSIIFEELPEEWNVDNVLRASKITGLENKAFIEYSNRYPGCSIIQYDIKNRNKILKENMYFENEKKLNRELEKYLCENRFSKEDKVAYQKMIGLYILRDKYLSRDYPRVINSEISDRFIEYLDKIANRFYGKVVDTYSDLKDYKGNVEFEKSFWLERNKVMVENIMRHLGEREDAITAVITCGYEHRGILKKLLGKYEEVLVREYWEE